MKYYSEEHMGNIRLTIEETVLDWPETTTKKMFGSPCFPVNNKLFAILVTNGIVVTRLDRTDRETLYESARSS